MVVSVGQVYNKRVYIGCNISQVYNAPVHIATLYTQYILMLVCNSYIIHPVYTHVSILLSNVHWV
jgi:hypothetical protein